VGANPLPWIVQLGVRLHRKRELCLSCLLRCALGFADEGVKKMSLKVAEEVVEAIKAVRSDSDPSDFVVVGFDEDDSLKVLKCEEGGIEAMKEHLLEDDVCYGLLRRKFLWEKAGNVSAETTKFIFLVWRPDGISLKRKMKIGTYDGQIKKLFASYHLDFDVNSQEEFTDEIVQEWLGRITQTADRTTTRKSIGMYMGGAKLGWNNTKKKPGEKDAANLRSVKGADVKWEEGGEEDLVEAIKEVREDKSSTTWALASYVSKDTLGFKAKGEGDVSEMLSHCNDTTVSYGIFRVTEQYDKTSAVKFCFVVWTPPNVPPMQKAIIATHKGAVTPLFRPYHQDFNISEQDELTEELALDTIAGLTGTKSHVTDRKQEKKKSTYARKFLGGVSSETQQLKVEDEEAIKMAIQDVRNDDSATDWCIAGYKGEKKKISFAFFSSGSGGWEELVDNLKEDDIAFALYRREQTVDGYKVVKFFLIHWQGSIVSVPQAGNAGVFHGAATALFGQRHDDIYGTGIDDLVSDAKKKIQNL